MLRWKRIPLAFGPATHSTLRSYAQIVASARNAPRYETTEIRKLVSRIRQHYFPPGLGSKKSKAKKVEPGISFSQAIKLVREKSASDPKLAEFPIIFQTKCKLAGENANGVRGVLSLAKSLNKEISILVFCPDTHWEKARSAGARYHGNPDTVQLILDNKLEFDRCIATVDQMPVLAKLARVLGPRGLMPNTKTGTLTTDVEGAVRSALLNTPFKIEKETGLFALPIALPDFSEADLRANLKVALEYLQSQNRTTEDGRFIETAHLVVGETEVAISKGEYGQAGGPKFLMALEKHRAMVAAREAAQKVKK